METIIGAISITRDFQPSFLQLLSIVFWVVIILGLVFFIFRELVNWYWKHNEMLAVMREILEEVKEIKINAMTGHLVAQEIEEDTN